MKVITVFGTRPEAIKMAPLIKELQMRKHIEVVVCVTAQHREMLDQVLETFQIVPDYDLNIMQKEQSLNQITSTTLLEFTKVLQQENPDIVLVHGDTTTTFAAALASFYQQIKIGHIEAGLRTYNKYAPYPEEINRQLVANLADYHFAPTEAAKKNLLNENKNAHHIYVTGNTAIDALKYTIKDDFEHEILEWAKNDKLLLLTAHRRENLGQPLENIFEAINDITNEFSDVKVVYPIHLNPKVREIANRVLKNNDKVRLIEPLQVDAFHNFMNKAYFILTDSGGIQEEAPSLGKPVLVLRDVTERPEGVIAGTLKVVGTKRRAVYKEIKYLLKNRDAYLKMSNVANPYGDGTTSKQIADILMKII